MTYKKWSASTVGEHLQNLPKSRHLSGASSDSGLFNFYVCSQGIMKSEFWDRDDEAILVSTGGELAVHLSKGKYAYSADVWGFVGSSTLKTKYLYRWIELHKTRFNYQGFQGSSIKHLDKDFFRKQKILIPSIEEQEKIILIISSVDQTIEATLLQIKKLEDIRKASINSLTSNGIGNKDYKGSTIGQIPKSWDVKKVSEVCKLSSGGTPDRSTEEYWGGDIPWIKTGEINYTKIISSEECITTSGLKNSSAKLIKSGAVLMAMYGQGVTRGRVAILEIDATINQACLAIEPKPLLQNKFLYYYLCSKYEHLRSLVQEGAQKNLSATIVKEIDIPIPPIEEQEKISEILDAQDYVILDLNKKLLSLRDLKMGLMQDLLTGKVRVPVN